MKTDAEIKHDVEAELKWTPEVDATDIAVTASGGAVSLSGFVRNLFEKYAAEDAACRVKGVAAVANDIEVRLPGSVPTDAEIARAAVTALEYGLPAAAGNIQPLVHQGCVTLIGTVPWHYQRDLAEHLMHGVAGVVGVRNSLQITPTAGIAVNVKERIETAFRRLAELDASQIKVDVSGSEITLHGEVRSWAERERAQATAWAAPGVTRVRNELTVRT